VGPIKNGVKANFAIRTATGPFGWISRAKARAAL